MSNPSRLPLSPGFWSRPGNHQMSLFGARARGLAAPAHGSLSISTGSDALAAAPQPVKRSMNIAEILNGAIPPSPVTVVSTNDTAAHPTSPTSPTSPIWASFCRINPIHTTPSHTTPSPSPTSVKFPRDLVLEVSSIPRITAAPTTRAFSAKATGKASQNEHGKANRFAPYDLSFRSKRKLSTEAPVNAPNLQQYHELSDAYMESILAVLESIAELDPSWDVEYNSGVLNLITHKGTFVINKQPANKQIWLSSPVSGPKRFDYREVDYCANSSGKMQRGGKWVYLRDGTTLTELLEMELDRQFAEDIEGEDKVWVEGKFE